MAKQNDTQKALTTWVQNQTQSDNRRREQIKKLLKQLSNDDKNELLDLIENNKDISLDEFTAKVDSLLEQKKENDRKASQSAKEKKMTENQEENTGNLDFVIPDSNESDISVTPLEDIKETSTLKIDEISVTTESKENQQTSETDKERTNDESILEVSGNETKDAKEEEIELTPEELSFQAEHPDLKYQHPAAIREAYNNFINSTEKEYKPQTIQIDENISSSDENENENTESNSQEDWISKTIEQYKNIYDTPEKEHVTPDITDDNGLHIEVDAHNKDGQDLTGTSVHYHSEHHLEIMKTKDNVEPKDQSYQHFYDIVNIAKENGSNEIELGSITNSEFRTKLVAATLANGMDLKGLKKDQEINLSPEVTKDMDPEIVRDLISKSLEADAKIVNPILDFSHPALQQLTDEDKLKYMGKLLTNEEYKNKIKNRPTSAFFAKDTNGNIQTGEVVVEKENADGSKVEDKQTRNLMNPYIDTISDENEKQALKNEYEFQAGVEYHHSERLAALRQKVINANVDIDKAAAMHDKVSALRNSIKAGADRNETLKNVTKEEHGNNFYQYAQKHKGRS